MPIAWTMQIISWWNCCISENEKKRNRTDFYWRLKKVCVSSIRHGGIEIFCLMSSKFVKIFNYFKSLCIIFMLIWLKYLVSILSDQNMYQGANCFNTPVSYTAHTKSLSVRITRKNATISFSCIYRPTKDNPSMLMDKTKYF